VGSSRVDVDSGPYAVVVNAGELTDLGVAVAERFHAECRRLFGETDEIAAAKTAASSVTA